MILGFRTPAKQELCLHWGFYCCDKSPWPWQLEEERPYFLLFLADHNLEKSMQKFKAETGAETIEECMLTDLLLMAWSVSLYYPRPWPQCWLNP